MLYFFSIYFVVRVLKGVSQLKGAGKLKFKGSRSERLTKTFFFRERMEAEEHQETLCLFAPGCPPLFLHRLFAVASKVCLVQ